MKHNFFIRQMPAYILDVVVNKIETVYWNLTEKIVLLSLNGLQRNVLCWQIMIVLFFRIFSFELSLNVFIRAPANTML